MGRCRPRSRQRLLGRSSRACSPTSWTKCRGRGSRRETEAAAAASRRSRCPPRGSWLARPWPRSRRRPVGNVRVSPLPSRPDLGSRGGSTAGQPGDGLDGRGVAHGRRQDRQDGAAERTGRTRRGDGGQCAGFGPRCSATSGSEVMTRRTRWSARSSSGTPAGNATEPSRRTAVANTPDHGAGRRGGAEYPGPGARSGLRSRVHASRGERAEAAARSTRRGGRVPAQASRRSSSSHPRASQSTGSRSSTRTTASTPERGRDRPDPRPADCGPPRPPDRLG